MSKYMKLIQLEYLALMALALYGTYYFRADISWIHYAAFFAAIDVIGYIPGRLWSVAFSTEKPPALFYWAYNTCHNFFSLIGFSALYWLFVGPDYALLALFFHLCADRGLLGNFPKLRSDDFKTPTTELLATGAR